MNICTDILNLIYTTLSFDNVNELLKWNYNIILTFVKYVSSILLYTV